MAALPAAAALGGGLRDISESLILSAVMDSYGTGDNAIRKDELTFCAGSVDYALMQTRGTIDEILRQMDVDSGYNSAIPALSWYYDELFELRSEDVMDDLDVMWNGKGDQKAVQTKWDSFNGRMDAIEDCKQGWNDSRSAWIKKLLHDVGMDADINTLTINDANKRIYALFDRAGKQHSVFTALNLADPTILDDGSIVYWEGSEKNADLVKRDLEGNVLVSYPDVNITGYNTFSSSSTDLIDSYFRMAVCGNVLRRKTESDFDRGTYQTLELVRQDGSAETICEVKRVESAMPYDLSGDYHYGLGKPQHGWSAGGQASSDLFSVEYWALDGGHKKLIIDARNGKAYSESDYTSQFGDVTEGAVYLNDQYFIDERTFAVYDKADRSAPVADLSDGGGVKRIFYSEESGQYWVISQTGYYYALDGDFRRIAEPVKLPGKLWDFCPFGLILHQSDDTLGLYDGKLNLLQTFPAYVATGFMSGSTNMLTGEQMSLDLTA